MPALVRRWLAAAARPAVVQPLLCPVPADDAAYARRKGAWRLAFRNARRWLQFATSGQAPRLRRQIEPAWRSCLWIHTEAPQVGDALMDLAPRSLLRERGIEVDLLAPLHLVTLFQGDRWFRRCFADGQLIDPAQYDFAVVSSHARRSLRPKQRFVAGLPWISLAGFYSVPDYHRALFHTRRLAAALGLDLAPRDEERHARQKLAPADPPLAVPGGASPRVALALGGVHRDRTYRHWPAVLTALHAGGVRSFVLVGSANALGARAEVVATAPSDAILHDRVGRTTLHSVRALVAACDLIVCADGGLMHLALTTSTRVLALFSGTIDPQWRLPPTVDGEALRAATPEVSGIAPEVVAQAVLRLLGTPQCRDGVVAGPG